jgi:hypothetical protein
LNLVFVGTVPSTAFLVHATDTDGGGFYPGIFSNINPPSAAAARTTGPEASDVEWYLYSP